MRGIHLLVLLALGFTGCADGVRPEHTPARFTEVAAGHGFTCALDRDGRPWCWGLQTQGRLGVDDGRDPCDGQHCVEPVAVHGEEVRDLSAGDSHACALAGTAGVCWGWNRFGALGDAGALPTTCPIVGTGSQFSCAAYMSPVVIGHALVDIQAGDDHTCAIASTDAPYCWGRNRGGQIGKGTVGDSIFAPRPVDGGLAARALAAGQDHTCLLDLTGRAYCWGAGALGRLGTGGVERSLTPVAVAGSHIFREIEAGGGHTCAITEADDRLLCWGAGFAGQVGIGGAHNRFEPDTVLLNHPVATVSAGYAHTCATTTTGDLYCWGANGSGQLGAGTTVDEYSPTLIGMPGAVATVSAGFDHTCAVTVTGELYCWGSNAEAQIGVGETAFAPVTSPVRVGG